MKKKKKKKPIKAGSAVGWSLQICLSQRGVRGTYWSVWETHSLGFSHIVLLLFDCTPPHQPVPSPLPSRKKAVNATKDTFPIVPWTAERSQLALCSCASSPGRRGLGHPNGELDAYHTKELKPLGLSPANLGLGRGRGGGKVKHGYIFIRC